MINDSKKFKCSWVLVNELCVGSAPTKLEHLEKLKSEGIVSILVYAVMKRLNFHLR